MSKRGFKTTKTGITDTVKDSAPVEAFKPTSSWKLVLPSLMLFKNNIVTASPIFIIPGLLAVFGSKLVANSPTLSWQMALGYGIMALVCVWVVFNITASYYLQLRIIADGQPRPGIIEIYRYSKRYIPRIIGLGIISSLAVLLGALALLVPGLIAVRRYFLAPYFLIDNDTGIRAAMDMSAAATKPVKGTVWSMLLVMGLLGGISWTIKYFWPSYGDAIAAIMVVTYVLIPALRYREIALQKSALAIED